MLNRDPLDLHNNPSFPHRSETEVLKRKKKVLYRRTAASRYTGEEELNLKNVGGVVWGIVVVAFRVDSWYRISVKKGGVLLNFFHIFGLSPRGTKL